MLSSGLNYTIRRAGLDNELLLSLFVLPQDHGSLQRQTRLQFLGGVRATITTEE